MTPLQDALKRLTEADKRFEYIHHKPFGRITKMPQEAEYIRFSYPDKESPFGGMSSLHIDIKTGEVLGVSQDKLDSILGEINMCYFVQPHRDRNDDVRLEYCIGHQFSDDLFISKNYTLTNFKTDEKKECAEAACIAAINEYLKEK